MSKGHKPGLKITHRSGKVLPATPCEVREKLLQQCEHAEAGPKQTRLFSDLFAHEKKHGCGKKLLYKLN